MANNFFLNNDPLLFSGNGMDRLSEFEQYQRPQAQQYDYLGELDDAVKRASSIQNTLNSDAEYARLSVDLQRMIQNELMSSIRWRLNSNPIAVKNMQRQMEIIQRESAMADEEQRRNLDEINDYIKNHSDITFDEYKKNKNANKNKK